MTVHAIDVSTGGALHRGKSERFLGVCHGDWGMVWDVRGRCESCQVRAKERKANE